MRIKKVSQTTPVQAQIVDGYSESTTDGYSANYLNGVIEKNAISVRVNTGESSYKNYNSGETLDISTIQNQVGDKFTTSGNNVIVGSGINKVKIQLNLEMRYSAATSQYYRISLTKNGTQIIDANAVFVQLQKTQGEILSGGSGTKIINVEEGDRLGLVFITGASSADINFGTGMYIEALE